MACALDKYRRHTLRDQGMLLPCRSVEGSHQDQTLQLLDEAVSRKVPTIAVCDRLTSPAGRTATWALPVKSDNMMFTNAVAAVTVLFNALAVEIATTHRAETIDTISDINVLLADDENILPLDR